MGVTGSGKTSVRNECPRIYDFDPHELLHPSFRQFANLASGSDDLKVGTNLHSCTSEIQLSKPFTLDGRRVVLIDTPGFNDTTKGDFEILSMITAFLERTCVLYPFPFSSLLTDLLLQGMRRESSWRE